MIISNKLKNLLICVIMLFSVHYTKAQAVGTPYMPLDKVPFSFLYGSTGNDGSGFGVPTADGGYIMAGTIPGAASGDVTENSYGDADCWLVKVNRYGSIEWQKRYGGSLAESFTGTSKTIKQTSDGGYIVACNTTSSASGNLTGTNHGGTDIWIFKLNATGDIQWQRLYGGSRNESIDAIIQTSDGGYIFTSTSNSPADGDVTGTNHDTTWLDAWIVKLTATGAISWQRLYGGSQNNGFRDVKQNSDGTYILAGYANVADGDVTGTSQGSSDMWIVKLNATGGFLWRVLYGGSYQDTANSITSTSDGGYIVTGESSSSASGNVTGTNHGNPSPTVLDTDSWVVKLNANGAIQWQRLYGGSGQEWPFFIMQANDGNYIFAGYSTSSANGDVTGVNNGGNDIWVVKVNTSGNILWQRLYGGAGTENVRSFVQVSNGEYILSGSSNSNNTGDVTDTRFGGTDYWLFKIDQSGNIVWVPDVGQKN